MSCCNHILRASETLTPCSCEEPGFCPRIGCTLNDHGYKLCRSTPGYYEYWKKNGGAPCVGLGESSPGIIVFGLGDLISWLIRVVTFGRVQPCTGCKSRIAWFNRKLTLWRRKV